MGKRIWVVFCSITWGILFFFSLNQNLRKPVFHHDSEIWADKAGYYVYLPATVIYRWNAHAMPDRVDSLTGDGFKLDLETNGILTKYPVGPALLEAPFFILGHETQLIFNKPHADGFSPNYQIFRMLSTTTYYIIGIFLLGLILFQFGYSVKQIMGIALLLITGTNVLYSAIWQPAMSHVYAFFSLSSFLYVFFTKQKSKFFLLLLAIFTGFLFDIRPLNLIILLPFWAYVISIIVKNKIRFPFVEWLMAGMVFIIVIIPFFAYKIYLSKHHFVPYDGETFQFLANPKAPEILFSATNGIFIYTPAFMLFLLGIFRNLFHDKWLSAAALTSLFLMLTIYGAWFYPTLGCGLGFRALIDFLPLFTLAAFRDGRIPRPKAMWVVGSLFCAYTLFLSYSYPGCLDDAKGTSFWEWSEYMRLWDFTYF